MIDGTTISLFEKPLYHGDAFYNRKSRYSINVQIVNTPNCQIIDYATGISRSRHNTHCFQFTWLSKNHAQLFLDGEWYWSDVGYLLQSWLMILYKWPNSQLRSNAQFNYALLKIRIWSEHTIDYLKGQFQFLKELCTLITSSKDVTYASCWIKLCIILHTFCIDSKLEINEDWNCSMGCREFGYHHNFKIIWQDKTLDRSAPTRH